MAVGMGHKSPADGLARALTIGDQETRLATANMILGDWMWRNPKAAQGWLAEAKSLPADWVKEWQAKAASK
jgi:hypothetical protein